MPEIETGGQPDWLDLSDGELVVRLTQRGMGQREARDLARDREEPRAAALIEAALSR